MSITDIWKKINPFVNIGGVILVMAILIFVGVNKSESFATYAPENQLIITLITFFFILTGVFAWDVLAGINIIEQKLKELEDRKE